MYNYYADRQLASKIAAAQTAPGGAPGGAPTPYGQAPAPYGQAPPQPYGQPPQGQYQGYPPQGGSQGGPQGQGGYPPQQQAYVNPNFYPSYPPQNAYPPQGQQQQPYGGSPYGQPPQPAYGQQSYGAPPQQQYGGAPPGAPTPSGPPPDANVLLSILKEAVKEKRIEHMYPEPRLVQMSQELARNDPVNTLCNHWKLPKEVGFDFVKLALFDVVFLLDDSGSMRFGDGLIDELKFILGNVAFATGLFDQDGFSVRFMNSNVQGDNIKTEKDAMDLVDRVRFEDVTPLATSLKNKILDPLVYAADRAGGLKKPFLVIIITDGRPTDNVHGEFQSHIQRVSNHFQGRGVVSFQIAQVGNDKGAQDFLAQLDSDKAIGGMIDCTSNFEMESREWKAKGLTLTKHHWYTKLLLGSIDSGYDNKDEDNKPTGSQPPYGGSAPSPYGAPPQQYGGPPQPYGGPPQPYGAPHQQPYGQPPQGQHPPGLQAGYGGPGGPGGPPSASPRPPGAYGGPGGPPPVGPRPYGTPQPYGQSPGGYPPQGQGGYPPQTPGGFNPNAPPPPAAYTPNNQYGAPPPPPPR